MDRQGSCSADASVVEGLAAAHAPLDAPSRELIRLRQGWNLTPVLLLNVLAAAASLRSPPWHAQTAMHEAREWNDQFMLLTAASTARVR